LDPTERKLTIKGLQEQLALLKVACNNYSKEFDEARLHQDRQSLIARRWDKALKESRALQFVLDSLEIEEREPKSDR
jgi:hypothetical protein